MVSLTLDYISNTIISKEDGDFRQFDPRTSHQSGVMVLRQTTSPIRPLTLTPSSFSPHSPYDLQLQDHLMQLNNTTTNLSGPMKRCLLCVYESKPQPLDLMAIHQTAALSEDDEHKLLTSTQHL